MSEMEFFLNLLNEEAADILLRKFGDNVKTNNLQLKKVKLLKIFRGISNKRSKTSMNPFEFAISNFKNIDFENLNETEMFDLFAEDVGGTIPDYSKLANALYYHPDKTKLVLEKIIENHKKQLPLFEGIISFKTNEEVEQYFIKNKISSNNIKESSMEFILEDLDKDLFSILKEIMKKTKDWTLLDYKNNFVKESTNYPVYLLQLAYLSNHENKQEIENGIALDMLFNYFNSQRTNNTDKDLDSKVDELLKENQELNKTITEIKIENENIKKRSKQIEKQIITSNKENANFKDKLRESEANIEKCKNENHSLKQKLIDLEQENKTYGEICSNYKILEKKNKELSDMVNYMNTYFEYACSSISSVNECYLFGIIANTEYKLCRTLFPEVLFIDLSMIDEEFKKKEILNINTIYIPRCGISTSRINLIENLSKKNNIEIKTLMVFSEKELIEEIVKIKYLGGK